MSSAEMHVKRFKCAPEVSFAPSFSSSLSFPSHPIRSRFHCSFRYSPHRRVNLFHVAVSSRVLTSCASYIVTGCIPPLFETSHGRDSSLFAGFFPSRARARCVRSAKESSLKYPPASCRAVNRVDAPRRPSPLSLKQAA